MELATSLLGAIVGAIAGAAFSYLLLRYQIRQARQDAVMGKLTAQLSPVLSRNTAARLEKDPGFPFEMQQCAGAAVKAVYLDGHEKAAEKFYEILDEYHEAVDAYVKRELDKESFERSRVKTSEQVYSLIKRHKIQL